MSPSEPVRVTHLTSAHPAKDVRIFHKECVTLADAGYQVTLVVAGAASETAKGVEIVSVPRTGGRIGRALLGSLRLGREAIRSKADIVHFHEPELLPLGMALRLFGKKVVYDAHEFVRGDVASKPYLDPRVAKLLSWIVGSIEWVAARVLTHVVTATPFIASHFPSHKVTVVGNYPDLRELAAVDTGAERDPTCGLYLGGLNEERCGSAILAAVPLARARDHRVHLTMAGAIEDGLDPGGIDGIDHLGMLSRQEVAAVSATAGFGIALLLPLPNCIDALPTKFFEYLASGMPAIVSRSTVNVAAIVDEVRCGIAVDGESPEEIAAAMVTLAADAEASRAMGERGAAAVRDRYNWAPEAARLLELYERISR